MRDNFSNNSEKRLPLSPQNTKKNGDKFYLIAIFLCALQRPAAGGEGCAKERSDCANP